MTKEQEEAIEICKELIKEAHACWIGISNQKAIETILSMLEEKDIEYKELTEAEKAMSKLVNLMKKVINEMAEVICMLDTMNNYNTRNNDIEEVKEYFYKKVEDKR